MAAALEVVEGAFDALGGDPSGLAGVRPEIRVRAKRGPTAFSDSPASAPAVRSVAPSSRITAAMASSIAAETCSAASRRWGSAADGVVASTSSRAARARATERASGLFGAGVMSSRMPQKLRQRK